MFHRAIFVAGIMLFTVLSGCMSNNLGPKKIVKIGDYGACNIKEYYFNANPHSYKLTCVPKGEGERPFVQITCQTSKVRRVWLSAGIYKYPTPKDAIVEYQFDDGATVKENWKRFGSRAIVYSNKKNSLGTFLTGMKSAENLSFSIDGGTAYLEMSEVPEGMVQFEKLCSKLSGRIILD
ncbi:MAG: hypothetical protein V7727_11640 [Sneathiella sp.]